MEYTTGGERFIYGIKYHNKYSQFDLQFVVFCCDKITVVYTHII